MIRPKTVYQTSEASKGDASPEPIAERSEERRADEETGERRRCERGLIRETEDAARIGVKDSRTNEGRNERAGQRDVVQLERATEREEHDQPEDVARHRQPIEPRDDRSVSCNRILRFRHTTYEAPSEFVGCAL